MQICSSPSKSDNTIISKTALFLLHSLLLLMLYTPLVLLFEQYIPVNNEKIQGDGISYELPRNRENENFLPDLQMYFHVDCGKKIFQMSLELRLRSMYFLIDFQVVLVSMFSWSRKSVFLLHYHTW